MVQRNLGWRCGEMLCGAAKNLEMRDKFLLSDNAFRRESNGFLPDHRGFDRIPFEEIGLYGDTPFRP